MKIFYLGLFDQTGKVDFSYRELSSLPRMALEITTFIERNAGVVGENFILPLRGAAYCAFGLRMPARVGIAISDSDSPRIFQVIRRAESAWVTTGDVASEIAKLESSFDQLEDLQASLDDIRQISLDNLQKLLKRGVTLEQLIDSSTDLSLTSKLFLKRTRRLCCLVV